MTWVNTPPKIKKETEDGEGGEEAPEEEEEPDEEENQEGEAAEEGEEGEAKPKKPKILFFNENDRHLRVPHERFERHLSLETLALAAPKT
jgi:hypothetical protein